MAAALLYAEKSRLKVSGRQVPHIKGSCCLACSQAISALDVNAHGYGVRMSSKSRFKPKSIMTCKYCFQSFHANTRARVEAYLAHHTIKECDAAAKVVDKVVAFRQAERAKSGKHEVLPAVVVSEEEAEALKRGDILKIDSLRSKPHPTNAKPS